jgi:hypothetical protein
VLHVGGYGERETRGGQEAAGAVAAVAVERVCCAVPPALAPELASAFRRAGLVVTEDADLQRGRVDGSVVLLAACPVPEMRSPRAPAHSTWAPVFTSRLIRTGYELRVSDDDDAGAQLELLSAAAGLDRDRITIKPPPGWRGYGHPALCSPP